MLSTERRVPYREVAMEVVNRVLDIPSDQTPPEKKKRHGRGRITVEQKRRVTLTMQQMGNSQGAVTVQQSL